VYTNLITNTQWRGLKVRAFGQGDACDGPNLHLSILSLTPSPTTHPEPFFFRYVSSVPPICRPSRVLLPDSLLILLPDLTLPSVPLLYMLTLGTAL